MNSATVEHSENPCIPSGDATMRPLMYRPRTSGIICSLNDESLGQCVPWKMRTSDDAFLGRCIPCTIHSLDDASLVQYILWMMHPLDDVSMYDPFFLGGADVIWVMLGRDCRGR